MASRPIEDYALLSNCRTAALVSSEGSIDWLCLPRFDSPSTFGALLGTEENGAWSLRPTDAAATVTRAYDGDTFILVTTWTTATGEVEVIDLIARGVGRVDVLREVRGIRGSVEMGMELRIRFGYSTALPWVRRIDGDTGQALLAIAGPDAAIVRGKPRLEAVDNAHRATFTVAAGEQVPISLTWYPSHRNTPERLDHARAVADTRAWWVDWASRWEHRGPYRDAVERSLLVLRALTHEGTGGIVAAATTSLPEQSGGPRNWDYRYVWLRDASLTLQALADHGYNEEVAHWRSWLLRAIAGDPGDVQIMYGIAGERYLPERELDSFPGYAESLPVRVGNGAVDQYQADVIGEVMVALHVARENGHGDLENAWPLQRALLGFLEENWQRPDQGIWEIRGDALFFTHSRVMLWAAFDRGVAAIEQFGAEGPVDAWRTLRDALRAEIDEKGVDPERGCFVQHYGSAEVDASLLLLPQVGFCAADDPRMLATVAAIESDLLHHGLAQRYRTEAGVDGLPPGENPFLACSFWLAHQYAESGRLGDALALMDRLVGLGNDVGLLAEEVDPLTGRHWGNTPQALSHLALVRAADAIGRAEARL
ncbi:glycoside hydrolase family 15 protein [Leifsonia sp. YIM 134122]|uniref:Glycoside hydrolase family 15 protein n=1 Tax=Leifsonia stereocauli TaxID=3134136 RepID=A0ABU9W1Z7_9MICO